jgi:hypothetical protein
MWFAALHWKFRGTFPYLKAWPAGRVLLTRNRVMDGCPGIDANSQSGPK